MKILILTGIYPPEIGGPAMYAKALSESFESLGQEVKIRTFTFEKFLPTGFRHLFFLFKIIPAFLWSEKVLILDTFSVALPAVLLSKIISRKTFLRTGGDFLWESYVERTKKKVLLSKFYETEINNFSLKEKTIFSLIGFVLRNVSLLVFSTTWQKNIFLKPYDLKEEKIAIIENCYASRENAFFKDEIKKVFVAGTRNLVWKNHEILSSAFKTAQVVNPEIFLDIERMSYEKFLEKISDAYAVILVSLGDISPNMILEAIRFNKPFILTKENGLNDRLADISILVDPLDEKDIAEKIIWLSSLENYRRQEEKIRSFNFTRTYRDLAGEFIVWFEKI